MLTKSSLGSELAFFFSLFLLLKQIWEADHYCIIKGKDGHPKLAKLFLDSNENIEDPEDRLVLKVKREQGWLIEV